MLSFYLKRRVLLLVSVFFFRDDEDVFSILSISYMWYTIIGIVITLVIGTVVSIVSCPQDPGQLDPKLVFPFLRRWIGKNRCVS